MRRRVTSSASLLVLLAALALPAPAGAQSRSSELTATGSVTVSWRGDAARGCAAAAVCDVQGRTVLPVSARGQLSTRGSAGAARAFGYVFDDRSSSVARVTRGGAGDPAPICVDAPPAGGFGPGGFGLEIRPSRSGRVVVGVRPTPSLSAGRCAGPLPDDLGSALPRTDAAVSRLLAGSTVDLSGRRAFAAGPFSGEVVSTVRVVVARARTRRTGRSGVVRRRPPRPQRRLIVTRVRALALDYRVASVQGAVTSSFAGLPDPDCRPLDACGLTGATTAAPRAGAPLALRARGTRAVGAAGTFGGALRDVRAGRLRLRVSYGRPTEARVRGDARRDGAPAACTDEAVGTVRLQGDQRGRALRLRILATPSFQQGSLLRSRCPGPGIAAEDVLAEGRVPLSALGSGTLTLRLRATGEDSAPGYAAAPRTGQVVLRLRRTGARVSLARRVRVAR